MAVCGKDRWGRDTDEFRQTIELCSGQINEVLLEADRRLTVREIAAALGKSFNTENDTSDASSDMATSKYRKLIGEYNWRVARVQYHLDIWTCKDKYNQKKQTRLARALRRSKCEREHYERCSKPEEHPFDEKETYWLESVPGVFNKNPKVK